MTTSNPILRGDDRGHDYDRLKFRGILEAVFTHTQLRYGKHDIHFKISVGTVLRFAESYRKLKS